MLCKNPFMAGRIPFGCGQCLPCRIAKRRQWMWRQFLESLTHGDNCFVTLTYDVGHIPGNWSLQPKHLQLFIKRLRKQLAPRRFRFFGVGEYGEESQRPHYHASLFGVSAVEMSTNNLLERVWGQGFVSVGEFNELTAQYISGYTVKKLVDVKYGRSFNHPEFARMSNRPGIGARAMEQIGDALLRTYQNWETGDVPSQLSVGRRRIPIGRYLLSKLRDHVGFTEGYIKQLKDRKGMERSCDMLALLQNSENAQTVKEAFCKDIAQRLLQVEARSKIWSKKGTL